LECIEENNTRFGSIENAVGVRDAGKNTFARRGSKQRSLFAPTEASEGPRSRSGSVNATHQRISRSCEDTIIVCGPRYRNNDQNEGTSSRRVKATVNRTEPNQLLVTFSGWLYKAYREEEQDAQRGDEGTDVHLSDPSYQAGDDVETEEVEKS
jgi:hypothetical protein